MPRFSDHIVSLRLITSFLLFAVIGVVVGVIVVVRSVDVSFVIISIIIDVLSTSGDSRVHFPIVIIGITVVVNVVVNVVVIIAFVEVESGVEFPKITFLRGIHK